MKSEDAIVSLLRREFAPRRRALVKGIGDDAAVLRFGSGPDSRLVVTTDMLVEDVDFRREWIAPEHLGWKALAVNLSDLAAMGAVPRFYTVALAVPQSTGLGWIRALYRGMTRLGGAQRAILAGGDLSGSSRTVVSITAIGECAAGRAIYRSTARPGDRLCVTGTLGGAAAGLVLLERGVRRGRTSGEKEALEKQRVPSPRCEVGTWLAVRRMARSMIDLSDGLSTDLHRLCAASGTGATIDGAALPVSEAVADLGLDPAQLALHGGEDFELLFSVAPRKLGRLLASFPRRWGRLSAIGTVTAEPGVRVRFPGGRNQALPAAGYDHFRRR